MCQALRKVLLLKQEVKSVDALKKLADFSCRRKDLYSFKRGEHEVDLMGLVLGERDFTENIRSILRI